MTEDKANGNLTSLTSQTENKKVLTHLCKYKSNNHLQQSENFSFDGVLEATTCMFSVFHVDLTELYSWGSETWKRECRFFLTLHILSIIIGFHAVHLPSIAKHWPPLHLLPQNKLNLNDWTPSRDAGRLWCLNIEPNVCQWNTPRPATPAAHMSSCLSGSDAKCLYLSNRWCCIQFNYMANSYNLYFTHRMHRN